MKKLYMTFSSLSLLLCVLLLATSCQKNESVALSNINSPVFTASSEVDVDTKTVLSANSVLWLENDEVAIFNGSSRREMYGVKGGAGSTSATLERKQQEDGVGTATFDANIAYYPYRSDVRYYGNIELSYYLNVGIPSEQEYVENSFANNAMPMVAITNSKSESKLNFKNLFGVLKLQLTAPSMTVKSITIKGNGNEKLAGAGMVTVDKTGYVAFNFTDGSESVKLVCNNVQLNETAPKTFYITLPPTTFSYGISVLVETPDKTIRMSTSEKFVIERSKIKALDPKKVETSGRYESEDYSKDGEVTVLQEKSVGNGINLVLLGDGFVDKDMNAGGKYEQRMRAAMEHFFSIEPLKSFRNRFNVYMVKAVSKNEGIGDGIETVFSSEYGDGTLVKGDNDLCLKYARKISGIPQSGDKVHILVALNDKKYAGTCYMYSNDMCVGYCPYVNGDDEQYAQIVHHEVVGHGFGKLSDEYYYSGTIPESTKNDAIQWYQLYGFYRNVDYTSDPTQIIWKSFLENPDYSGLVGIYEGASTYEYGVWRSSRTSIMVDNVGVFNAVSREAIYRRIMEYSGEEFSHQKFLEYDVINRTILNAAACCRTVAKDFVPLAPPVFVR